MKKSTNITIGLFSIAALGIAVFISIQRKKKKQLTHIADEGYEFANDILYPNKRQLAKNLRYGPVLPE